MAAKNLAALFRDTGHRVGDEIDHAGFPVDQFRPVQPGLADFDAMKARQLDLMQCVGRGHEHFLRCVSAIGSGSAEIPFLDESNRLSGLAGRGRYPEPRIAAADDDDIELVAHGFSPSWRVWIIAHPIVRDYGLTTVRVTSWDKYLSSRFGVGRYT